MSSGENSAAAPSSGAWPQPLYTYDADGGDGHGVRGVTGAFATARRRLITALRTMSPGASGTIRQAYLDMWMFPHPDYRYGPIVARARRDADADTVIFDNGLTGTDAPTNEASEARHQKASS